MTGMKIEKCTNFQLTDSVKLTAKAFLTCLKSAVNSITSQLPFICDYQVLLLLAFPLKTQKKKCKQAFLFTHSYL